LLTYDITVAILCFSTSLFALNIQNLLGEKHYKKYFQLYLGKSVLILILPLAFYPVLEIPGVILGMALGNFVIGLNFFKGINLKVDKFKDIRSNIRILAHNFSVESSTSIGRMIDKLVIVPLFGFTSVAYYQFNLQILWILSVFPTALYLYLLSEESSGEKQIRITYFVIISSVLLTILGILISPYIINSFFPKFTEGILGFQIMIFSLIPYSISSVLIAKLQSLESTKVGFSSIIKIGSLLILIAVLGNLYGLLGLSSAVVISTSLECVILFSFFKRLKR